ncbi:hypothetical protein, partial [Nonomuraea dietziae]|uniref:hypothetical protein n=1 Tax=Nonomuraea dietziae TaxID=65515 RepID=UPI00342CC072
RPQPEGLTTMSTPTPAQVRELAAGADDLADAIEALRRQLSRGEDTLRQTGYRLDEAAGWIRQAAQDLQATASDMVRLAALPPCRPTPAPCRGACAPSTATPSSPAAT